MSARTTRRSWAHALLTDFYYFVAADRAEERRSWPNPVDTKVQGKIKSSAVRRAGHFWPRQRRARRLGFSIRLFSVCRPPRHVQNKQETDFFYRGFVCGRAPSPRYLAVSRVKGASVRFVVVVVARTARYCVKLFPGGSHSRRASDEENDTETSGLHAEPSADHENHGSTGDDDRDAASPPSLTSDFRVSTIFFTGHSPCGRPTMFFLSLSTYMIVTYTTERVFWTYDNSLSCFWILSFYNMFIYIYTFIYAGTINDQTLKCFCSPFSSDVNIIIMNTIGNCREITTLNNGRVKIDFICISLCVIFEVRELW